MRPLPNFDFSVLDSYEKSLEEIEKQIRLLVDIVNEQEELTSQDKEQLTTNIQWLKRFYEAAERNLIT